MKKQAKEKDNATIKKRTVLTARYVTQVAVMAGLLTALKFALSFLPNVEVITLLIAVFSTVWGIKYSLPATLIFCTVEMAIYGIGSWVPLYFVYWPLLAVIFHFALRGKKTPVAMGIAVGVGALMTAFFGVLSASIETLFVVGAVAPEMLGTYFVSYYVKGLWYYIIHFASVVISILALYIPLVKISEKIVKGIHHTPDLANVESSEDGEESKIDEIGNEFDEMAGENLVTADEELSVEVDTISCQQDNCNLNDVEN